MGVQLTMSHTDGIDNIMLTWDDEDGEYYAGQLLKGRIEVHVKKTTKFRGVFLKISGFMRIKWFETENGSNVPYEEYSNIMYENMEIFKVNMRDPNARWIFPGKHIYNFQYKLPEKLPYSLDGSRYGRIMYKSKAEVMVPGINPVESLEEEFFIVSRSPPEIEALQQKLGENQPRQNVEYGVLGGGCFVKKSRVELFIKLERSLYKQGQYIRPVVECTVEKGTCDVDGVTLLLVQEMIYTCNLGEGDDQRQKKEVLVVSDDHDTSDADPGETKVYDKLKLKVNRNLPVSGYPHCEYIDCGYYVHAVAKTASTFDDIVVKLPVIILAGDKEDWELESSDSFEATVGLLIEKNNSEEVKEEETLENPEGNPAEDENNEDIEANIPGQTEEGNEGGEDNMEEVMGNPTDEETPVAEEEEAMADDDMM